MLAHPDVGGSFLPCVDGTFTTSEIEFYFVTDPRNDHRTTFEMLVPDGGPSSRSSSVHVEEYTVEDENWPRETKLTDAPIDSAEASFRRQPWPPEKFVREMQLRNDQLVDLGAPPLIHLEFVCARLCTLLPPPARPFGLAPHRRIPLNVAASLARVAQTRGLCTSSIMPSCAAFRSMPLEHRTSSSSSSA